MIINKSTKTSRIYQSPFAVLEKDPISYTSVTSGEYHHPPRDLTHSHSHSHSLAIKLNKDHDRRSYSSVSSVYFDRDLRKTYTEIVGGKGNFLITKDGSKIFDAATGAAVSCLGYGNKRVAKAINQQLKIGTPYLASSF